MGYVGHRRGGGARPIEKRDDNHRKGKLESFATAIYLHSHEDVDRQDSSPAASEWRMK
jgi:hypothetical protein